jgi:hypothetical protein
VSRVARAMRWAAGAFLAPLLLLPACASPIPGTSLCLPPPLQVSPSNVVAGSPITVSSGSFQCDGSYPSGKTYQLVFGDQGHVLTNLGNYPVNRDGSFKARVSVPVAASVGEAYIVVSGSSFDRCNDGGGSCASYVVGLNILPNAST